MIYSFTLQAVAVVVGLLWFLFHLPGVAAPAWAGRAARAFPRNTPLGIVLIVVGTLWAVALTLTIDLGEFSPLRGVITLVSLVLGVAMAIFSREYLAVRALSVLLLLGANVLLDAAFLRDEPAKLVVTTFAYVWIIAGITFLFSPYRLRDLIEFGIRDERRTRILAAAGAAFGLFLVALGLFVY